MFQLEFHQLSFLLEESICSQKAAPNKKETAIYKSKKKKEIKLSQLVSILYLEANKLLSILVLNRLNTVFSFTLL